MAKWTIDTKAQTATVQIFGGELKVFPDANGNPEALWVGVVPEETKAAAMALIVAEAEGLRIRAADSEDKATTDRLGELSQAHDAVRAGPDILREEGPVEVTAFLHFMDVGQAIHDAPAIIRNSLRQSHRQFFDTIAAEAPPEPYSGPSPF